MAHKPTVTQGMDFENDVVMKDIRENFREPVIHSEEKHSFFHRHLARKISIGILALIALLYILARLRL